MCIAERAVDDIVLADALAYDLKLLQARIGAGLFGILIVFR